MSRCIYNLVSIDAIFNHYRPSLISSIASASHRYLYWNRIGYGNGGGGQYGGGKGDSFDLFVLFRILLRRRL
jgi:hypothetical protein